MPDDFQHLKKACELVDEALEMASEELPFSIHGGIDFYENNGLPTFSLPEGDLILDGISRTPGSTARAVLMEYRKLINRAIESLRAIPSHRQEDYTAQD